jgi:creatinine amidohydrolase
MKFGEKTHVEIKHLHERVVVLPLGSLEQHGHHLPMLTDSLFAQAIADHAEAELGEAALFLPALWLGASDHHRTFAGTVSLSNGVYQRVLEEVLESLIDGGARRIFLLNAHGGNINPARVALTEVQLRHCKEPELYIAFSSWWTLLGEQLQTVPESQQRGVLHACEIETSLMLYLRPELVKPAPYEAANPQFASVFYHPVGFANRVDVVRTFDQLSESGAVGLPQAATIGKGEVLLKMAVEQVVAFVQEFAHWPTCKPQ